MSLKLYTPHSSRWLILDERTCALAHGLTRGARTILRETAMKRRGCLKNLRGVLAVAPASNERGWMALRQAYRAGKFIAPMNSWLHPSIERGVTMSHLHTFSNSPAKASDITATEVTTRQETAVGVSTHSSSKRAATKPLAASYLLAAYSAWATSCSQARSSRASKSREQTTAHSMIPRSD